MEDHSARRQPIRQTALQLIGELGSESSAHGVARIVRSRDRRRKVVWSLLVLFGVGAAIAQLSSLVHKYLQYQVVEVSEIQDGLPVEFPSVTLCNIEPISWRKLRQLINHTTLQPTEAPPTFHRGFDDDSDNITDDDSDGSSNVSDWLEFLESFHFGEQDAQIRSIRAFHENVGREAMFVRHSLNESLLHCSFNKQPCSTANFTTTFDGNYYNCFTFNAQSHQDTDKPLIVHSTGPEHGLSVVMFLDNNEPPLGTYGIYALDTNILHSAGARVMVHAPNTLPIPADHGHDVAPGFSTSMGIKPFLHARLSQPYGNCSDTRLRGLTSFDSTFSTCIAVCKQELVMRACRCRSSTLPLLPGLEHLRVPYCGQVPGWRHMLRNKDRYNSTQTLPTLTCEGRIMDRLKNDRGYETDCGCTHPCGELSYHMSTSMSYWPTELYQYDALNKLFGPAITTSPLARAYQLHHINIKEGEALMNLNSSRTNSTTHDHADNSSSRAEDKATSSDQEPGGEDQEQEATASPLPSLDYNRQQQDNLRKASTEIRQNMLRLNVYLEDLSVVKFKQMPAYGVEDLFADIGGTLGLWMGVSVLTMIELLELVIRLSYLIFGAEWRLAPGPSVAACELEGGGDNPRASPGPDFACSSREGSQRQDGRGRERGESHGLKDPGRGQSQGQGRDGGDWGSAYGLTDLRSSSQVYSYRTEADFGRGPDWDPAARHEPPYQANGRQASRGGGGGDRRGKDASGSQRPRTDGESRTKYWRLKKTSKSNR